MKNNKLCFSKNIYVILTFLLDRPFIPDFIPAVGDIDAFIRVPRPDGQPEGSKDAINRFGSLFS